MSRSKLIIAGAKLAHKLYKRALGKPASAHARPAGWTAKRGQQLPTNTQYALRGVDAAARATVAGARAAPRVANKYKGEAGIVFTGYAVVKTAEIKRKRPRLNAVVKKKKKKNSRSVKIKRSGR